MQINSKLTKNLVKQSELDELMAFSDTETVVGTWFGKPLYRKSVYFGSFPSQTSKTVVHNISNIEYVPFYLYGWYDSSDKIWYCGRRDAGTNMVCNVLVKETYVNIDGLGVNWSTRTENGYVTIYYTKTTD